MVLWEARPRGDAMFRAPLTLAMAPCLQAAPVHLSRG